MKELLQKWMANDFADFEGLTVTGTVPIPTDVINEVLAEVVRAGRAGSAGAAPSPSEPVEPGIFTPVPDIPAVPGEAPAPAAADEPAFVPTADMGRRLLRWLRKAEVRASEGKVTLDFEVRR